MRRFIISADITGNHLDITGRTFHHMKNVLRMKEDSEVVISDGKGMERTGRITIIAAEFLTVCFTGEPLTPLEPAPAITIYQGLPKGEKMDLIVQKGTELGAAAIISFIADRSVKKIQPDRTKSIISRWERIAEEAAQQSGTSVVPRISLAATLTEALQHAHQPLKLLLWEKERCTGMQESISSARVPESIGVIIGPEGGMTDAEVEEGVNCGFIPVSLGNRILRTETVGIAVLSILQFKWGSLGCRPC